jgi:hypothetical protein
VNINYLDNWTCRVIAEGAERTVDLTIARLSQHLLLEAGLALDAHGIDDAVGVLRRVLETADVLA